MYNDFFPAWLPLPSLSLSPLPLSLSLSLLGQLPSQLQAILVNDHSNPRKPGLLMLAIFLSFSLSSTSTHSHALTHTHTLNYSCFDEELKENGHNFRNHLPSVLREERFEESKQSQQRHRQRRWRRCRRRRLCDVFQFIGRCFGS